MTFVVVICNAFIIGPQGNDRTRIDCTYVTMAFYSAYAIAKSSLHTHVVITPYTFQHTLNYALKLSSNNWQSQQIYVDLWCKELTTMQLLNQVLCNASLGEMKNTIERGETIKKNLMQNIKSNISILPSH